MSYNIGRYNRYITYENPTDVNTKGSLSRTWTQVFTCYAMMAKETSSTDEESGRRTTLSKSTWKMPYNTAIKRDGRFYEPTDSTKYYYVVGVIESDYQTEMTIEAELRV